MKSALHTVNTGVQHQRIDLGEKAVEKVRSDPALLAIVESAASRQVFKCRPKNSDPHSNRFRNSFLASSQSRTSIRPAAKSASVFRNSA